MSDGYQIPKRLAEELDNWRRAAWAGALPHPMPPGQSSWANLARSAIAREVVEVDGSLVVEQEDCPEPQSYNLRSAELVNAAYTLLEPRPRKVLRAEVFGFGKYSFRKQPVPRPRAARLLGLSLGLYEADLRYACERIAFEVFR